MNYSQYTEAPRRMHFWCGVSAIAACLRRKVWIPQVYFQWYPNFYIIIVAPPGIVSKSTTSGIAYNLVKKVPGLKFGPDVATWQSLVTTFSESAEAFELNGEFHTMSAISIESSELGNLLDPQDRRMIDAYVALWDGKQGEFKKETKHSGSDSIVNPWINLIGCTTPGWIADNFPQYMIGGGFTSRCIWLYADTKEKLVAYLEDVVPPNMKEQEEALVADLTHISANLAGAYKLTDEAKRWGRLWYEEHYTKQHAGLDKERFGGYIARKQTHMHKLAMILAASQGDEMVIQADHLKLAHVMITDLEPEMQKVFAKIGRQDSASYTERFINYIREKREMPATQVFRDFHQYFPSTRDLTDMLQGCQQAGYIRIESRKDGVQWVVALS